MRQELDLTNFAKKTYHSLGEEFSGTNPQGGTVGFTNYYMEIDGKPFFAVCGEFHYSRCEECRWEDEIIKMKMGGITVISTYVFWIHHEEEEGVFDFTGRRNLRRFLQLCEKHGMYVIVRIGPYDHGEVRNGGIPDWMYGKPFEVRRLSEGYLFYVRRLYAQVAKQLEGLLYKDGGPVIAAQIDNEYMHSSSPWELMTGVTNEWVFGGDEGETYMRTLLAEAKKCGIEVPFYTCTGWGGAAMPDCMMPLWGGYAYRPWLYYAGPVEHPVTDEYVYQDFHNNEAETDYDFHPVYRPEDRPYACCEMGGGMNVYYNYRFVLPFKSIDAMTNIKLASGCNFLGYYMYQGGTNPKGKHGLFLNECQVPKMSYDYQAALGEFGQIRESYRRLKSIHLFCQAFGASFCEMQTVLPEGASRIDPKNLAPLRFSVRTDGRSGYLFLNNFQDHVENQLKKEESVELVFRDETVSFEGLDLAAEENCFLPFHMDLGGIDLVKATAQPVTKVGRPEGTTYVFLKPEGMKAAFFFENGTEIAKTEGFSGDNASSDTMMPGESAGQDKPAEIWKEDGFCVYRCSDRETAEQFRVTKDGRSIEILVVSRALADQMYLLSDGTLLFSEASVLEDASGVRLETTENENRFLTWPKGSFVPAEGAAEAAKEDLPLFDSWTAGVPEKVVPLIQKQTAYTKWTVTLPEHFMDGLKDVLLRVRYQGDIACAFIDGDMVHDNFCNGAPWEIGLRTLADRLERQPLTIVITPLKKGVNVNVESAMAARMEHFESEIAELEEISACPVYELKISNKIY